MEEINELKQSHQQEQSQEEEDHDEQDKAIQDQTKVIPIILEVNQSLEDTKEQPALKADEISIVKETTEAEKVEEIQLDSSKKPKQGLKQNQKTKHTIPQPFALATDKRMSRERRVSMDFKDSKPKLSKSISLNYKGKAQSAVGAEGISDQKHANSSTAPRKISSKPKKLENGTKTMDRVQLKEAENKRAQAIAKKQEREELEVSKLRKSSTFKASPLPSFYHRKDTPPKSEIKKIPVTRPKSPLIGQRSKSMPNQKREDKVKVPIARSICNPAKEAINKLLKTNRKIPNTEKINGN